MSKLLRYMFLWVFCLLASNLSVNLSAEEKKSNYEPDLKEKVSAKAVASSPASPEKKNVGSVNIASAKATDESATAQDTFTSNLNEKKNTSDTDYLLVWVKLFLFLGLFLLVGFFVTRVIKKKNQSVSQKNDYFEVLGEMMVDMNKKLKIVKVLNNYYVLGISIDGINLISKVESKEDIDLLELKGNIGNSYSEGTFFKDLVTNYFNSRSGQSVRGFQHKKTKAQATQTNKSGNQFFNALNITKNLRQKLDKM